MKQFLLSTYTVDGEVPGAPKTSKDMQTFMERVMALEAEMDASGTFVFGGALNGPDTATVINKNGGKVVKTDGPFAASNKQIGGFYIINAEDLDSALAWANKVVDATNHPIEVRPFHATGRVKDAM